MAKGKENNMTEQDPIQENIGTHSYCRECRS